MEKTDRISFLAEWNDPFSSVIWKFSLFFYLSDETIEMYDLLKHRLFLKRTKCENVRIDDLFIGASIRIFSRLIIITDYADSYTRSIMDSFCQKTCVFLKPDIGNKKGLIFESLTKSPLKIINVKMVQLSDSECHELFREYEDESILESVIKYITSGPIVAIHLLGENSVNRCIELIGPEDPDEAKKTHPDSLRARYGTNKVQNGLFVSSSLIAAQKDAMILFGAEKPDSYLNPVFSLQNTTCCVIKPHAVKMNYIGGILTMIEESEYEITGMCMCILSTEEAEKFLEIYKYVLSEYQDMVLELCSGPCIALEVKCNNEDKTISQFRKLVGPMDSDIAKVIRPDTIRARFGKTKIQNSVHVTDLVEDASKEIEFLFKNICRINCTELRAGTANS